jgi:dipeptidyl aminopeptidase/acylaminoacyl peptidase
MRETEEAKQVALRPVTAEDIHSFRVVGDIDLSPDGRWLAYVLEEVDASTDQYFSNLWLIATDGGVPKQLTFGLAMNQSPRFSPDGSRLAFLSNRAGASSQLYSLPLDGGEALPITHLKAGAGTPVWSPDGKCIAFSAKIASDRSSHAPHVVRRLMYKTDGQGLHTSSSQIFVVPSAGGDADQLTQGEGNATEPSWSPTGEELVFCCTRSDPREAHRSDLWRVNRHTRAIAQLTHGVAHCSAPAWAPDGQHIAFYGSERAGDSRQQVWLTSPSGDGERRILSENREVGSFPLGRTTPPLWNSESSELAVLLIAGNTSSLTVLALDGGEREVAADERQFTMLAQSAAGDRFCFLWSDLRLCGKISTLKHAGSEERLLVNANEHWESQRRWPQATFKAFTGRAGRPTQGLLLTPERPGPWPLLVDVHGGPHSYVEFGFPYHPYWYILCCSGWAVLSLNASGSASYGKRAAEQLRGRWGELDLPEHLAVVDQLIAEGVVDGNRLAIAGKSYGGYMAAWAIGKTKRFRAAVCSAGVTNLESHFGTSDSGYYVDPYDMGGEPHQVRKAFHELSPIHDAETVTTPTLILHGEADQRCPIGQGEELFTALMRTGKCDVEFVRYPGGSHRLAETGRPSHRVDYHSRIAEFVQRYTT